MRSIVEWQRPGGVYRSLEPGLAEFEARTLQIAAAHNGPFNEAMVDNRREFSARGVLNLWKGMRKAGGRPFLLWARGSGGWATPTSWGPRTGATNLPS